MMTNEEICRDFLQAKKPKKQIEILADLNECSTDEILRVLIDGGLLTNRQVGAIRRRINTPDAVPVRPDASADLAAEDPVDPAAPFVPIPRAAYDGADDPAPSAPQSPTDEESLPEAVLAALWDWLSDHAYAYQAARDLIEKYDTILNYAENPKRARHER